MSITPTIVAHKKHEEKKEITDNCVEKCRKTSKTNDGHES